MTWHSIFDLSTLQHRHIVYTYALVLLVNAAYAARLLYIWNQRR